MAVLSIDKSKRENFNEVVHHPLQSYEWGEFREKTGIKVIRRGFEENPSADSASSPQASSGQAKLVDGFQLTIHNIPKTPYTIGYLPKSNMPTKDTIEELRKIGHEEKCIFIQLEPNIRKSQISNHKSQINYNSQNDENVSNLRNSNLFGAWNLQFGAFKLIPSAHPLFTKYTFILDLTKPEEKLLKDMHAKTRYNIRLATRKGVTIEIDNSDKAFEKYWELTKETTTRQKFYAHTKEYHKLMWQTLRKSSESVIASNLSHEAPRNDKNNKLTAHLLTANYQGKILTTWILFVFKDTLFYPYGASSSEHRDVMASKLIMWEAIKFGKSLGLKKFDMWGALGGNPDRNDPWYGFHRFKSGYGPEHVEFVGSFDLVINPVMYQVYKVADKLRWVYLRIKS